MKATRTVPGRPVNDTGGVTRAIIDLVAETLDRSSHLDAAEIRSELDAGREAIGLLAAGGHLRRGELVMVAPGLRLQVDVPVGEDALSATENTDPPRGVASADEWTLHLPAPDTLAAVVNAAARSCPHVSLNVAPNEAPPRKANTEASKIDLSRLTQARS
jgi:hypothetical protein